jgi:hypothetical protein
MARILADSEKELGLFSEENWFPYSSKSPDWIFISLLVQYGFLSSLIPQEKKMRLEGLIFIAISIQ